MLEQTRGHWARGVWDIPWIKLRPFAPATRGGVYAPTHMRRAQLPNPHIRVTPMSGRTLEHGSAVLRRGAVGGTWLWGLEERDMQWGMHTLITAHPCARGLVPRKWGWEGEGLASFNQLRPPQPAAAFLTALCHSTRWRTPADACMLKVRAPLAGRRCPPDEHAPLWNLACDFLLAIAALIFCDACVRTSLTNLACAIANL